ncbi:MAG TPA: radical SAM protein [Pseudomonadales bacterium]|nr:radical SAM protein [Pseudomonadales bacterium]
MAGAAFAHLMPAITDATLANRKYLNLLQALRARRDGALTVDALPFDITINASTGCNLSCPYCEVGKGDLLRPAGLLKKSHHDSIMAPLLDTLFIARYFGTGESLLNPHLPEMIALSHDSGVYSVISTNLSIKIDDAYIDRMLDSGLTLLSVACDGASRETYEKYRVGGDFDLVQNNMRRFIERKRERGLQYPLIEWRFLVFSHNEHEVDTAREMAKTLGVDIIDFYFGVTPRDEERQINGDAKAINRSLTPATSGPGIDAAVRRKDTPFRTLPNPAPKPGTPVLSHQPGGKCDWLYFAAYLYPKGEVAPCCHPGGPEQDMGIAQHGVDGVWNSSAYQNARAYMKDSSQPCSALCVECPMPKSKDRQFNHVLSAIFRNAPLWFLKVIALDGDRWLHPLDRIYLTQELGRIDANRDFLAAQDCSDFLVWLQENMPTDSDLLFECLAGTMPPSP